MEQWMMRGGRGKAFTDALSVNPLLGKLLSLRCESVEDAREFLNPLAPLASPFLLTDMDRATELVSEHIRKGSEILIFGDYDVDGVTATTILMKGLKELGAKVRFRLPERLSDGYGISAKMVEEAREAGVSLCITCDNGIRAFERIESLKAAGMDVLLTDHHLLMKDDNNQDLLPKADVVINPHRQSPDATAEKYPTENICGAFVAYLFIIALWAHENKHNEALQNELMCYAAFGTVCDCMPLLGENRKLVVQGLAQMNLSAPAGIDALARQTEVKKYTPNVLGFQIGPMLNAGGRLGSINKYMPMLLDEDESVRDALAAELREINLTRRGMTEKGMEEALISLQDKEDKPVFVIYQPDLHESLAGLLAGNLKEMFNRTVLVVTKGQEGYRGSARATEEMNIVGLMTKTADLFAQFGGHDKAAGFSPKPFPNMDGEAMCRQLEDKLNENCDLSVEQLERKIYIDAEMPMSAFTISLLEELSALEPFGEKNEEPHYAQRGLTLYRGFYLGREKHKGIRMLMRDAEGRGLEALTFDMPILERLLSKQQRSELESGAVFSEPLIIDIVYTAKISYYKNWPEPEFVVQAIRKKEN